MSFLHDPYYDDAPVHEKIKPKQLIKIPYDFFQNGFAPLDEYIRLSPMLDFLKTTGCLVIMTNSKSVLFYCDCSLHLKKAQELWTEGVAFFPLVLFEDHMNKLRREKTAPVKKSNPKLKTLLDELHSTSNPCKVTIEQYENEEDSKSIKNPSFENPAPEKSLRERAEDILDLIRKRQNKKK